MLKYIENKNYNQDIIKNSNVNERADINNYENEIHNKNRKDIDVKSKNIDEFPYEKIIKKPTISNGDSQGIDGLSRSLNTKIGNTKIKKSIKNFFWNIKNISENSNSLTNLFIVPGDIIYLKIKDEVPCDCLILEGYCSVTESYLTGESNTIMKEALPKDVNQFSYSSQKSILYQGSKINSSDENKEEKLEKEDNPIKCLVINTGFNTYWGSFLQNILFPNKMNFKMYYEIQKFIKIVIVLLIFEISIIIYLAFAYDKFYSYHYVEKYIDQNKIDKFLFMIMDLITIQISPIFFLCNGLISFYFNEVLKRKNITCVSDKRLNASGKVNIMVLDKTGTLTSDDLDVDGFQTFKIKNNIFIEESHKDMMKLNFINREFWTRYSLNFSKDSKIFKDYKTKYELNPVYFMECMVSCLSIDRLDDGKIIGNNLDREIYKLTKWEIKNIKEKWNNIDVK
jgi:magnesium-transporting ATPase (P-type)